MKVELLPHIAARHTDGTVTEFPQWALVVDGDHVGWVPKEGTHIAFFQYMPPEQCEQARIEVEKLTSSERISSLPLLAVIPCETEEQEDNEFIKD